MSPPSPHPAHHAPALPLRICQSQVLGALGAQSCLTLCDPMDCSPPGSSVHGISQARILQWVAISSFRESSRPRDQSRVSCISPHWQANSLPLAPPGKSIYHRGPGQFQRTLAASQGLVLPRYILCWPKSLFKFFCKMLWVSHLKEKAG